MKKKTYCVYDSKVGVYGTPFYFLTHGQALRGWVDIANDPNTEIGKHPEDFTLFELGSTTPQPENPKIFLLPNLMGLD